MNSQIDINVLDKNEIINLKDKLNNLLGERQKDIEFGFNHDKSYYEYCFSIYETKIETLTKLNRLKFSLPLIEASVNVNKALREYKFEKNEDNLLKIYTAQKSLELKIEETINNNKNAIDNSKLYRFRLNVALQIAILLGLAITITLIAMMSTLEPEFPEGSYLVLTWIMSCVPVLIVAIGLSLYFDDTRQKEMIIYEDFLHTQEAFESRNKKFANYFQRAENAFQKREKNINNNTMDDEENSYSYSS